MAKGGQGKNPAPEVMVEVYKKMHKKEYISLEKNISLRKKTRLSPYREGPAKHFWCKKKRDYLLKWEGAGGDHQDRWDKGLMDLKVDIKVVIQSHKDVI